MLALGTADGFVVLVDSQLQDLKYYDVVGHKSGSTVFVSWVPKEPTKRERSYGLEIVRR